MKSSLAETDAKGFELNGQGYIVVQYDGQLAVYENHCPHLGIELNYSPDQFFDQDGRYLMCANHGALFEPVNGQCVYGPCQGQSLIPVPFEVQGDAIVLNATSA